MELSTAINLIRNPLTGNILQPQTWADLGCGKGLFTEALTHILPNGSTIYAIDKAGHFSIGPVSDKEDTHIVFRQQDIELPLNLPPLEGVLMANVLHYIIDKEAFVDKLKSYLRPKAYLLLVEYDTDIPAAQWVPYPISFNASKKLFLSTGFSNIELLNRQRSLYGRSHLYAALISR